MVCTSRPLSDHADITGIAQTYVLDVTQALIWQSIHIDDLSRNFAMNPGEGLKVRLRGWPRLTDKIKAYKQARAQDDDRELTELAVYVSQS